MIDIFHPVLNNDSIFKIYQCKDESFLYSILAALYSKKIGKKMFHQPNGYKKFKSLINIENVSFPIKNKSINNFFKK